MRKYAIILAAGKGTRMKTELPKCAYPLLKKPMIAYIVENLKNTNLLDELIVVVGHKKDVMIDILNDSVSYAHQDEQLGTGHAVLMAKPLISDWDGYTIQRRFRNTTYHITVQNPDHVSRGIRRITVDGEPIDGHVLPVFGDSQVHEVVVRLGKS